MTERGKFLLASVVVYLAVAATGVLAARQAHEVRALFDEIERLRVEGDAQLVEYRQLLLERATLSAYHDVESIAGERGMHYPRDVRRVTP